MSTNLFDKEGYALSDADRKVVFAKGTSVPANGATGFQTGCYFILTNGGETGAAFINVGSPTSAQFVNLGTGGGLVETITLTSAEVKALRAAPKTIIAAPGAGKAIVVDSVTLQLNYGGTNAFTESTDNLVLQYGDSGTDITGSIETTGFIDQTADTLAIYYPANIAAMATATIAANEVVELFNTGDGEIAGNAANDNTLVVTVGYRVITIS